MLFSTSLSILARQFLAGNARLDWFMAVLALGLAGGATFWVARLNEVRANKRSSALCNPAPQYCSILMQTAF